MNRDIFNIALTIDVDSDFFDSSLSQPMKGEMQWNGIETGIPLLVETFKKYKDSFGNPVKITWFIRVDNQLKGIYEHAAYLLIKYRKLWEKFEENGDEIGWHPHLYRKLEGKWIQETRPSYIKQDLKESYKAMIEAGFCPICSRIGEAFHSNEIMIELFRLGIKIDSTAMPGRVRIDTERHIDWKGTPYGPYYPSMTDYRLPGKKGDRIGILEVPMSMIETKTEYDKKSLKRYVDLSFRNHVMKDGLEAHIRNNDYLLSISHPSTILPLYNINHPLVSYDIAEVEKNLNTIISKCNILEKRIQFITVSEFLYKK
ncbi:MAG: hypothetical protein OIN86_14260 [Candidatus Methanoperedens sp.]|nr:hypothetical protein [Candidatus Methanoperedens sp.]CAG0969864.1 hypothetical protein METP1_01173 [Methanosarcinales archaeon]